MPRVQTSQRGFQDIYNAQEKRPKLAYKAKKLILIDIESKRGTIHHLLIMNCPRRDQWIRKNNKMNCDVKTMFYICALIRHWPIDRNIFLIVNSIKSWVYKYFTSNFVKITDFKNVHLKESIDTFSLTFYYW